MQPWNNIWCEPQPKGKGIWGDLDLKCWLYFTPDFNSISTASGGWKYIKMEGLNSYQTLAEGREWYREGKNSLMDCPEQFEFIHQLLWHEPRVALSSIVLLSGQLLTTKCNLNNLSCSYYQVWWHLLCHAALLSSKFNPLNWPPPQARPLPVNILISPIFKGKTFSPT